MASWQHLESRSSRSYLVNVVQVAINVHGGPGEDHGTRLDFVIHILKVRSQQASGDRRHQAEHPLMLLETVSMNDMI